MRVQGILRQMKFNFLKKSKDVGQEQRIYTRIATVFPVEIRFVDKKTGKPISKRIQCFTRDISKGGMCLQLYAPQQSFFDYLDSDQYYMSLIITPPFSKHPITAFANKAWVKKIKENAMETVLLGIFYENIIEQDRKRLYRYVNSLRRKPYEISALILLLVGFGAYIYFNYYSASQSNISLNQNISTLQESDKLAQQKLNKLKQKEITLKGELSSKEKHEEKLKKDITAIAINQTDEKTEALIRHLQASNNVLNESITKVNEELKITRQKLIMIENKQYSLQIFGNEDYPLIKENDILDIITLNNANVLIGNITRKEPELITLNLSDGTSTTLLRNEITNIMSLRLVDYELFHKATKTTDSSNQEQIASHRDTRLDFLKKIEYDTFKYFTSEVNKDNGLAKDNSDPESPASIAATGFAMIAWSLASDKGWMDYEESYDLCLKSLQTANMILEHENGFFYRFVDLKTGQRVWNSEVSSMDTSLFIAGALVAGQYFKNSEVSKLAQELYDRVNWTWMCNNTNSLSMGWKPESGFLPYYWHTFNESILTYILATGSSTHALPISYWHSIKKPKGTYKDQSLVYSQTGSLFVYQIPHVFVNFKQITDNGLNYWNNTIAATYANRQFCIDNSNTYKSYGENSWGLTASDGPNGYKGYGAKPGINIHDGTVSPSAAAGSLPLTPEISIPALRYMYDNYKNHIYGFYGFRDSFNINQSWFSNKFIGINQGLTLCMIENYMESFVWTYFEQSDAYHNWKQLLDSKV